MTAAALPSVLPVEAWDAWHRRELAKLRMITSEVAWLCADGSFAWELGRRKGAIRAWREAGYRYGQVIDEVNFQLEEDEP